jgi:hypothetical protein
MEKRMTFMNTPKVLLNYAIDENVPVPPPKRTGRPKGYPFHLMELDDSVFIADKDIRTVVSIVQRYKKMGKTFTCRTEEGGVRVWRTT